MPYPQQLQNTIHDMEQLLDTMIDPTMDPKQYLMHTNNIGRINHMLQWLYTNPKYIEVKRENGPNSKEIENSTANIQRRMSENLANLQAWKTAYTKTRRQEEAVSILTNIEWSHNTLHEEIMQHFDQFAKENPSPADTPIKQEHYQTSESW